MQHNINPFEEDTYPPFIGMPKDTLTFLRALKKNNNREWFEKNKERFESSVKDPFYSLLHDVSEQLKNFDQGIHIDPKRSIYRIYRDMRFSKDKTPYKTWIAASFTFQSGDRKTSPGYYMHIAATEIIIGGGSWMPSSDQLKNIRYAISEHPDELRRILSENKFKKMFGALEGESMKTVPKGFDKDHPAADLLKMRQFLCSITREPEESLEKKFLKTAVEAFKTMTPFVKYLFENC